MPSSRQFVILLAGLVLCCVSGCVTEGGPAPKPRIGPQPRDARADVLLLNISQASDTDGDTVPDMVSSSVHMFDERYQLPVSVPGTVTFTLYDRDAEEVINEWVFAGPELQRHLMIAQVGPVYRFRLRIPIDQEPVREPFVTIQCVMEADSGLRTQAWHRDLPWLSFPG